MANLSNINNKFLVTTGGNVGIEVTGPTKKLDVYQSSTGFGVADFRHVNGNRILVNPSYNYYDAYNHIFRGLNGTDTHLTISNTGKATFAGDIELDANLFSTGQNLKFHAAGTHVMNIDINGKVYPAAHNSYDIGHSTSLAWRNIYSSGTIYGTAATFTGSVYAPDYYLNDYIYHNGDTNTYIRVQADQWTFRTGGDDRMHIDNSGVGIFTTSPQRTLDVRGNGLSIYGSGGNTELMLRGQVEGTGTVRNVGSWHWSIRGDVGGNNDDLKLLRFVTGNYSGIAMQLGNSDGVATFYSKIIAPQLSIQNQINTTSSNLEFNFKNGDGTTTNFKDFYIRDGKNGVILNIQGSSKISNFLGNVKITTSGYPLLDIGISSSNYFRIIHDNPGDRLTIGKNAAASLIINGNGNVSTAGLLTPTSLDTNAYLSNGYQADLHARFLGQAIYGSGTGGGDNYGTVADIFRYKDIAVWRKNSSTNAWSNPSTGNTLVQGNYAHKWGGINMEPAYSEYIFYFSNSLGYSFLSQTIVQHSTNGNSFDLYLQSASSTTNPYDSAGWTTMVTQTGISSWPGITCIQRNWQVGGGYPGLFRIRLVPSWNNGNVINIGSFQAYGSYGNFSHAWTTLFDRSVNFQSKIGVGTDPSRALDVTQTALIQGAGNVSAGTLALGSRSSGTAAWSTISGSHYNQSSGSGNGSGSGGIMMIGTWGGNGENDLYIGGGVYEMNAATAIRFHTHTTNTSTVGGTERMRISSVGRITINTTVVADGMCTIAGNSSNYALNLYADSLYSGVYRYQRFRSGSNIAGGIEGSNQTSVQYVTTSDYRTKKNIKPLENGLDRVCKLKPVKFDWKLNDETTEGFIAHEVQDIFPEAVSGEKDGEDMQGMDYGRITPLLVKAIQELKAEIDELKK